MGQCLRIILHVCGVEILCVLAIHQRAGDWHSPPYAHAPSEASMASSVSTNRDSFSTECIGYHLGIVTGIGTDKDDAMSTVSDPHPVSDQAYHYLLSARSDAVFSLLVHSGRSFDEDRS